MITLPFKIGQIQSQGFGFTDFALSSAGQDAYGVGRPHEGLDFYSNDDLTIYSIANGTVILDNDSYNGSNSGLFASYGNFIVIKDDDSNRAWYYCHLDENYVEVGQKIKQGDKIAKMGGSGNNSRSKWGLHLHLGRAELDANNSRLNKSSISYGYIDGSQDLQKAIDQYNKKLNTMPNFYIQSEEELNNWISLYGEARLKELKEQAKSQQQPSQPKPETTLVTNKYYQGLLNDGNVALAVSDLIHRDVEIANLKAKLAKQDDDSSTLHSQVMSVCNPNQKPTQVFEPQHAQTNTANNFIQPTDKSPLIESWRAKITSGHIMEVLQSFFWGFFGYLVLIKFDLQSYSDPIGIIGGLATALQQYTAIRQPPAQLPNQK